MPLAVQAGIACQALEVRLQTDYKVLFLSIFPTDSNLIQAHCILQKSANLKITKTFIEQLEKSASPCMRNSIGREKEQKIIAGFIFFHHVTMCL
jgi:hypothetical protein